MNDEILAYSKERLHELKQNIEEVKEGLEIAAANAGRKASDILLLAVSKTMPTSDIAAAMALGMKDFAESRPQELMRKFDEISDENIHFHLIGQLQKNKVKYIINRTNLIHSLSTDSALSELERLGRLQGIKSRCLLEVNTSGEESKAGVPAEEAEAFLEKIRNTTMVEPLGLMTIAPYGTSSEEARPYFAELRKLSERLSGYFPGKPVLSMGMSGDYIAAIKEGSDIVRIGTAIFGKRDIK